MLNHRVSPCSFRFAMPDSVTKTLLSKPVNGEHCNQSERSCFLHFQPIAFQLTNHKWTVQPQCRSVAALFCLGTISSCVHADTSHTITIARERAVLAFRAKIDSLFQNVIFHFMHMDYRTSVHHAYFVTSALTCTDSKVFGCA